MGSCLPRVSKISNVHQTDRGLWVELGVEYNGVASATIETCGLNLGEEDAGQVNLPHVMHTSMFFSGFGPVESSA